MRVTLFAAALICACAPLQAHSVSRRSICQPDDFICDYFRCVKAIQVCDGLSDCSDGRDEQNCGIETPTILIPSEQLPEDVTPTTCGADQFQCSTGDCLPARTRCNKFADCADGSDERGCPPPTPLPPSACRGDQFECWDLTCVPEDSRCDGINDCADRSDEYYCPPMECRLDQFRCSTGKCVGLAARFSGEADCSLARGKNKTTDETTPREHYENTGQDITPPGEIQTITYRYYITDPSIKSASTAKSVLEQLPEVPEDNISTEQTTSRVNETETILIPSEQSPKASVYQPPVSISRPPAPAGAGDRVLVDLPTWLATDQDAHFSLSLAAMLRHRTPRDKLALQINILRLFKSKVDPMDGQVV